MLEISASVIKKLQTRATLCWSAALERIGQAQATLLLYLIVMLPLLFIAWFIAFYTALGGWLILQGIGLVKRAEPPSSTVSLMPYAKLGDPPSRQVSSLSAVNPTQL